MSYPLPIAKPLASQEVAMFYHLWKKVVQIIADECPVLLGREDENGELEKIDISNPAHFAALREVIWEDPVLLDKALLAPKGIFSPEEKEIIRGWQKYGKIGRFAIVKHFSQYSIFMSLEDDVSKRRLYAVHGLVSSIKSLTPPFTPCTTGATIIPFLGRIIADGVFNFSPASLDVKTKGEILAAFRTLKETTPILETFDIEIS